MDLEEIRAEIKRRKQRAQDLNVPHTVGFLYRVSFGVVGRNLHKDPELVLPEIRHSLKMSGNVLSVKEIEFRFNGSDYRLVDTPSKKEIDYWGDETDSNTITLHVNGEKVFELWESRTYKRNARTPAAFKTEEEIKTFIEGPWVRELSELNEQLNTHRQEVEKRKYPPEEDPELKEEMKKFGL